MGRETITIDCYECEGAGAHDFGGGAIVRRCSTCDGERSVTFNSEQVYDLALNDYERCNSDEARRFAKVERERNDFLEQRDELARQVAYLRTRLAAMGEGMPALIRAEVA